MKKTWTICCFLLIFSACEEARDLDAEVAFELEKKIKKYKKTEVEKCLTKATQEAEIYVDSIIALWVSEQLVDTMTIPEKPNRPTTPAHILGTVDTFLNK